MRGGSSPPISPEMSPEGLPWPGSPAAIFPLPGGRGVAASGWVPPASQPVLLPEKAPLPDSSAHRRRQVARRRPLRGTGAGAVRADVTLTVGDTLGPRQASETALPRTGGQGTSAPPVHEEFSS